MFCANQVADTNSAISLMILYLLDWLSTGEQLEFFFLKFLVNSWRLLWKDQILRLIQQGPLFFLMESRAFMQRKDSWVLLKEMNLNKLIPTKRGQTKKAELKSWNAVFYELVLSSVESNWVFKPFKAVLLF